MPVPQDSRTRPRGSSSISMFPQGAGTSVEQAVERLNEASSNLSTLLEQPPRHIMDPDLRETEYSGEAEINRRRAKRRRVDTEPQLSPGYKGFSYGHRGQVVAGPLKMEIVSCDGGVHPSGSNHYPENILRNDKSVYCTQSNECNIILRHQGKTTFSLKRLIIKGPEKGFTSPIQEGMIFVSMDSIELLPRTCAYRVCEEPSPQPPQRHDPALLDELPVLDLDTGELLSDDHRPPSRRADGSIRRTVPPSISNSHLDTSNRRAIYPPAPTSQAPRTAPTASGTRRSEHTLVPPANLYRSVRILPGPVPSIQSSDEDEANVRPYNFGTGPPPPPIDNFTVTTDCSEPTSDEEEPSSAATLADLLRRDRAALYAEDSDNESTTEDPEIARILSNGRARPSGVRLPRSGNRLDLRRELPSRIEVTHDWDVGHGSQHGPLDDLGLNHYEKCMIETNAQMKGVLAPHARFFIEKEASCVTVNFEPAVSGRFILLKMWSPPKLHNIDIQSIVVHGYAGTRFFPAAQPL